MSKTAKFVLILLENANWIENQALQFYTQLFKDAESSAKKYTEENFSIQKLMKIQNDFSVEIVMVYEDETPKSFMKLNSSRLYNQNLNANKPICITDIVYSSPDEIKLLINRAEEIGIQRKHDLIWVKALKEDLILIEILEAFDFKKFTFQKEETDAMSENHHYFKKKLL
ncbi:hypothetical protein [Flavobacterium hercynium]|uniref:Uncharacterized protein n=1 Tax=Flavobacterium hercynium TaxID=387094 RepID=A0A226H7X8_9FLAO|nr:hypothetical protein [Flavobacterium hercynium]OXA90387.1 hypothetical protein B0A66_12510 [Flavobacterium hercynium]SMP26018.1 hypothetical protein SAMN06265346_10930 [Flavobacterium hercynium]